MAVLTLWKCNLMRKNESLFLSLSLSLYGNAILVNPFHDGSLKPGDFSLNGNPKDTILQKGKQ
jgi:hypothetical protein